METKTFCTLIKEQTQAAHHRAESQRFIQALLAGELDVRSLVHLLEGLLPVYEELELQFPLAASKDSVLAVFDHRRLDRAERIRADLASFGRSTHSRPGTATEEYVRIIKECSVTPNDCSPITTRDTSATLRETKSSPASCVATMPWGRRA